MSENLRKLLDEMRQRQDDHLDAMDGKTPAWWGDIVSDNINLLAAVEAVLEEHYAETLYRYVGEDVCPQHDDNQLEETMHGEWVCMGCPSDDGPVCATCVDECGEALLYPCPTAVLIHASLIGDDDE